MDKSDPGTDETALDSTPAPRGPAPALRPAGYTVGEVLGRGGMGEVVLAIDERIGRRVAIKRMLGAEPPPELVTRFLREARIQARLDHPAIVPVYELGEDDAGRPYFTMKRLAGVTLAATIADRTATTQRMLRAFAEVCHAIDLAHARGVVHRDLKPTNIMLGDYGEVYVIDWGIAHVTGDAGDTGTDITTLDGETEAGAILGTPGYMAPEQIQSAPITPAADVYALGAILFEILAREPVHPRGAAALATTITVDPQPPGARFPDRAIPTELDAACARALRRDPTQRPTARELGDMVERYLDGDRDLEQRRKLAAEQLAIARAALDAGDPARRADAIRAAGRALALDPASADAALLVSKLMIEPPREQPAELATRLDAAFNAMALKQWREASLWFLTFFAFVPVIVLQGVRDWAIVGAFFALIGVFVAQAWTARFRTRPPSVVWGVVVQTGAYVLLTRMVGLFVIVPGVLAVNIAAWATYPMGPRIWWTIAAMIASLAVPLALEAAGVLASTWSVGGHGIALSAPALDLRGWPTAVFLITATLATLAVTGFFVRRLAADRLAAHRDLESQAWHLRQLLPK